MVKKMKAQINRADKNPQMKFQLQNVNILMEMDRRQRISPDSALEWLSTPMTSRFYKTRQPSF
jgi:hypothetical protein